MDLTIRIAKYSDLQDLAQLFNKYRIFYKQSSDPDAAINFLRERLDLNESVLIVAEDQGELVGFSQLYPKFSSVTLERDYVLNDLYVDSDYRGKSIGKKLLNFAQEFIISKGFKGLMLETDKTNPAQALYEREGWIKDTDHYFYYWTNDLRNT